MALLQRGMSNSAAVDQPRGAVMEVRFTVRSGLVLSRAPCKEERGLSLGLH